MNAEEREMKICEWFDVDRKRSKMFWEQDRLIIIINRINKCRRERGCYNYIGIDTAKRLVSVFAKDNKISDMYTATYAYDKYIQQRIAAGEKV